MIVEKVLRRFRTNFLAGIALGLFVATGLSAWVTFLRLTVGTAPFQRLETTYTATVALYYAGGLVGGALVGLLLPLRRSLWGAALLGMVGVFPLYFGVAWTRATAANAAFTLDNVAESALLAFLVGGAVGIWIWLDDNPQSSGVVEKLRHPTVSVVATVWACAVAVASLSYFVLPRWTGNWNFTLVVLTAFVLFIIPLALAVLVTMAWTRESDRRHGS